MKSFITYVIKKYDIFIFLVSVLKFYYFCFWNPLFITYNISHANKKLKK